MITEILYERCISAQKWTMVIYILYTIMYKAQNKTLYKKERSHTQIGEPRDLHLTIISKISVTEDGKLFLLNNFYK